MGAGIRNTYIASSEQISSSISLGGGASPVVVNMFAPTSIEQGTWAIRALADQLDGVLWGDSSGDGAQNDGFTVKVYLNKGTYSLDYICYTGTSRGICTVGLDGTPIAYFDHYAAADAANVSRQETGITIATSGLKTITFLWATKNASSSGYKNGTNRVTFTQTA